MDKYTTHKCLENNRDSLFLFFFLMRYTFLIPLAIGFAVIVSEVQAADVIVRNVNLGGCTIYSDGCNTHTIKDGVDTQTTSNTCIWEGIPQCLDNTDSAAKTLATDFKLKKFNSCDDMENVLKNFIKEYYSTHPYYGGGYYRGGPIMMEDSMVKTTGAPAPTSVSSDSVQ